MKALPAEVLLTIAGLKLLKEHFSGNRNEWNLVAGKAVSFIRQRLGGVLPMKIDEMLQKLKISFHSI